MLGLPLALAVHDGVVGVALERAAREVPGHPGIERVVHEQVRQDRRDRRPLRSSLAARLKGPVWVLERGGQPPLDIPQHPAGVGDRLDHEVPRHLLEERPDVEIDHPVVVPAPLPACRDRVVGRPARPVAIVADSVGLALLVVLETLSPAAPQTGSAAARRQRVRRGSPLCAGRRALFVRRDRAA
jgi:hypothetical protein